MIGLEARELVKSFGEPPTIVLKSVSLAVEKGDFVSITGRSGSGKSTLLYMMSGLDTPSSGSVYIDGMDIADLDASKFDAFRNTKVGFVFQFHYLLPELSAIDNI
ncbi:MAG: ATP-binding cassette domain-containing protein, partial [Spirochaetia bacterium]|nr:ATP-binding cassette domain-containing protein [Spirochaetia bacterium]